MKIIITGSLGNISQPLAKTLLLVGHQITIISSNAAKAEAIKTLGAIPAIGSLEDVGFLTNTFAGADAVYTMVPPNLTTNDFREYAVGIANSYATALQQSGVKRIVNLSSIGAHLENGTGPITGIHDVEVILNSIPGIAVKHIRAPFFYYNFFNNIDMIKHMDIIGNNYPADTRIVLIHPEEIAATIATELQQSFTGKGVRYIYSDDRTAAEVAQVLGAAIGKPGLPWAPFEDEQIWQVLVQNGMSAEMGHRFVELGVALRTNILWEDFDRNKPVVKSGVALEDFAAEFADRYQGKTVAV
ncbi:NAD(P)H-binding protein [Chitinophaga defluvii]|uniref:NAD(P)H-binding protein n=1 Tax=Chitinophaga defluvii TaxID=3163343 RepID=A0ABV2T1J2_9BACT